jgi:hypothetical protein
MAGVNGIITTKEIDRGGAVFSVWVIEIALVAYRVGASLPQFRQRYGFRRKATTMPMTISGQSASSVALLQQQVPSRVQAPQAAAPTVAMTKTPAVPLTNHRLLEISTLQGALHLLEQGAHGMHGANSSTSDASSAFVGSSVASAPTSQATTSSGNADGQASSDDTAITDSTIAAAVADALATMKPATTAEDAGLTSKMNPPTITSMGPMGPVTFNLAKPFVFDVKIPASNPMFNRDDPEKYQKAIAAFCQAAGVVLDNHSLVNVSNPEDGYIEVSVPNDGCNYIKL